MVQKTQYLWRHLAVELSQALAAARIVNVVGPRQVGKTTLVRDLYGQGKFYSLDDETTLQAMESDAWGFLSQQRQELGDALIMIDEVQRSTSMVLAIKRIVDQDPRGGQFLLTGSSNIFASAQVSDSLVGRVLTLPLWPLTVSEMRAGQPHRILDWALQPHPQVGMLPQPVFMQRQEYVDIVLAGGYPALRGLSSRMRAQQYREYVDTVVRRDVGAVWPVKKPQALKRLVQQVAIRTAAPLNISALAQNLGIQRPTVEQYLDVLTRLYLVVRLSHWTAMESKRDRKSAKYHFVDTGMVAALRGLSQESLGLSGTPQAFGGLLESFVFNEVLRSLSFQQADGQLYHWSHRDGREIDILLEAQGCLVGMEVKASTTVTAEDFRHLRWFAGQGPGRERRMVGIVFYLGQHVFALERGFYALPVSMLWAW